jgi:hypothetical protein
MKWMTGFFCWVFISCTAVNNQLKISKKSRLELVGTYELSYDLKFANTIVGGLSGIDYDRKKNLYYLISDDRSATNPARFYKTEISFTEKGIDTVKFLDVVFLRQAGGTYYPGIKEDRTKTPDPESIRFYSKKNLLAWSNEGERIVKRNDTVLIDPGILLIDMQGKYVDSFGIPSNIRMRSILSGPRQNGGFEGMTFSKNYKTLLVSLEEPLYEDGDRAGLNDSTAIVRFIEFDVKKRKPVRQYAYKIDPVAIPPDPPGAFQVNGISEILSIGKNKLLVIERSFSVGTKASTIKIFLADLNGASEVSKYSSVNNMPINFVKKELLLNMQSLGIHVDNVEGITAGPVLPNGHATIILVADNNFSKEQVGQLFLFEITR